MIQQGDKKDWCSHRGGWFASEWHCESCNDKGEEKPGLRQGDSTGLAGYMDDFVREGWSDQNGPQWKGEEGNAFKKEYWTVINVANNIKVYLPNYLFL